jgi:hypothetical protein
LDADRKTRKRYTRADLKDHELLMAGRTVAGDRSKRRLKKTIIARIIT